MRSVGICLVVCCVLAFQAANAASPFDGVYNGSTYAAGNGYSCNGNVPEFKVTVRDGQFNYGGGGNRVPVVVAPDGSFSAQSGQRYLQGKIVGNHMTGSTAGGCNYIWDLHK